VRGRAPHPDIGTLYANAVPGASAVERLKRVRELIDMPPANKAGALVLARAAIDAFDWALARQALANYSSVNPSQAVCLMMAEIEEGETSDKGKAREWMTRAVRAPREPQWTADGITAEDWEPLSPVSGKLDAFEWRVPTSAVAIRTTGSTMQVSPPTPSLSSSTSDDAAATTSLALPEDSPPR
jgi:HemY protein